MHAAAANICASASRCNLTWSDAVPMHTGHLQASCGGQQGGRGGDITASMPTTTLSSLLCHGSASAGVTSMMAASCESPCQVPSPLWGAELPQCRDTGSAQSFAC